MVRRKWLIAGMASSVMLVSGCAPSNLAFNVSPADKVGTWTAESDFGTVLTLNEDGSLTATGWPTALGCDGSRADDMASLRLSARADISGDWSSSETRPYELFLHFGADACSEGGSYANIWRRADGKLDLCAIIPSASDPDTLTTVEWFVLNKDPHADAGVPSCSSSR